MILEGLVIATAEKNKPDYETLDLNIGNRPHQGYLELSFTKEGRMIFQIMIMDGEIRFQRVAHLVNRHEMIQQLCFSEEEKPPKFSWLNQDIGRYREKIHVRILFGDVPLPY